MDDDDFFNYRIVPPEHLYHWSDLVDMEDLSDATFRTLVYLYTRAWKDQGNWIHPATLTSLAEARGISLSRLVAHLKDLEEKDLVQIENSFEVKEPQHVTIIILGPKSQRGPTILLGQSVWVEPQEDGTVTAKIKDRYADSGPKTGI